jgi:Sec-independent protein secretion pathway component TatC
VLNEYSILFCLFHFSLVSLVRWLLGGKLSFILFFFFFPVWSELFYECWNSSAWWVNSRKSPEYVQLNWLYLQLKAAGPVHMLLMSPGRLMVSMWCLNDSTVGWLRNSGASKFQVTMVLGRNEYLYTSTLVLICRMLWAQAPLVLVVLIWMCWWSGTSTRLFKIM